MKLIAVLVAFLAAVLQAPAQTTVEETSAGEVAITIDQFGVGNAIRPGSWGGLQVTLDYAGDQPKAAVVVWRIPDADGDIVRWRRTITLNPGAARAATVWLYADLSIRTDTNSISYVEVYEALDPAAGSSQARLGELLAVRPITPGGVVEPLSEVIGVIDSRSFGLDNYRIPVGLYDNYLPTGHALSEIVTGLQPESIPDRWMGLDKFSVLIWGPSQDRTPGRLTDDQATAIREWVARGGHFVVMLPRVADIWTARTGENPLDQLLPAASEVRVTPVEEAPLSLVRHLLTDDEGLARLSGEMHLFTFSGPGLATKRPGEFVRPAETVPLMTDRLGRHVAIQRAYGTGTVSVLGLDFDSAAVRAESLPDTDVFWNRVLGRRYHAPTLAERQALEEADQGVNWNRRRDDVFLDEEVPDQIAQSGSAAAGLLLAVLVFAAYWLLAGPGTWGALRYRKLHQHAWVAFLLAAAVFTAISWIGAALLKPRGVPTRHHTVITAVSGQELQSAVTFFGALLPDYGSTEIQIGADDTPWHSALGSFEDPRQAGQPFPDPRDYAIESDNPYRALVPTRATAKQMKARWLGQVEPPWGLPYTPEYVRVTDPTDPARGSALEGVLRHSFPQAPDRVVLIYVGGEAPFQTDRDRVEPVTERARLLVQGLAWAYPDLNWSPGDPLDLADVTPVSDIRGDALDAYLDSAGARQTGVAAALYHHALPPNYGEAQTFGNEPVYRKRLLYSTDLSQWLTRPCLIVFAEFSDVTCPVPLSIDDEPARSTGKVQFRWVYPLPHTPRPGAAGAP